MTLFTSLLTGFAVYYAALVGAFAWGFRRVRREQPGEVKSDTELPFVSVVVCARDEEASIETCLRSILGNDYPEARFEVVVVDDFSQDATVEHVRAVQAEHAPVTADGMVDVDAARVRLVRMADVAEFASGHKHDALVQGIVAARGDVIVTTDADCVVRPGWLRAMMRSMTPETAFVSGPVLYPSSGSALDRIQALEFLGLIAVGAGAIGTGRPNMCNSANVAYRRDVRDQLAAETSDRASPAEDEVLLQRIAAETEWNVTFCADPEAAVVTEPVREPAALFQQRMRWAGAGARYPSPLLVALVAAVWAFYALLLTGLVTAAFAPALLPAVTLALVLKAGSEAMLLRPACRHFGRRRLFRLFLPAQLLQIPYVVVVGAAGVFGRAVWKGRRVT